MSELLQGFQLPPLIVSPTDVARVRRELEALDAYLAAQALRAPGLPISRMPKVSRLLDDLAVLNKQNLLHATARRDLLGYLRELPNRAAVVHVSFAVEPTSAALQKIVLWLRQNAQPDVLVSVGLQPNIVAGCIVRTTNRYFDFSLRNTLRERRTFLLDALQPPAAEIAEPTEVVHG